MRVSTMGIVPRYEQDVLLSSLSVTQYALDTYIDLLQTARRYVCNFGIPDTMIRSMAILF